MNPLMRIGLLLAFAGLLNSCGTSTPPISARLPVTPNQPVIPPYPSFPSNTPSGVFQKPAELMPAVEFWHKTYVNWRRANVAIHDDRYLDVVYEVMTLPGEVGDSLTATQKEIVRQRRDYWKTRLMLLENKWRHQLTFDNSEQALITLFQQHGHSLETCLAGASDRVRSQRGTRERFIKGLEISRHYEHSFRKIFRNAGLPEDLAYLPHVESSFQPSAKSSAGAVGMWQFTQGAAKTFMPGSNKVDLRMDPVASTHGAARYLKYAFNKLHDWPTAITSYNHGIGGMKRAQSQVGNDFVRIVKHYSGPNFGFASRNYYAQFLAAREIANNSVAYLR